MAKALAKKHWISQQVILLGMLALVGCKNGPFAAASASPEDKSGLALLTQGGPFQKNPAGESPATLISQTDSYKTAATQFERLNADLTSQLADARKSASLLTDRVTMLQDELNKQAIQTRDAQLARLDVEKRLQAISVSARSRAGATISSNSSARGTLRAIQIPGVEVRQESDQVRISLPSDKLFAPGSDQLLPSAALMLEDVARSVTQAYPRQLMSVEAFTDDSVSGGLSSPHQLTAAQSLTVLRELTGRYRMPANQMITVAHGSNVPRVSSGAFGDRARNRRVELVIHPDTVGP